MQVRVLPRARSPRESKGNALKVNVFSRRGMEATLLPRAPHMVISVRSPGDPDEVRLQTNEHTLAIVRLEFFDMDDLHEKVMESGEFSLHEPSCFQPEHARAILDAFEAHAGVLEEVIVHCDAGLSRSPAIAAALTRIHGLDDGWFFKRYMPNMRVYRTLLEEHHARHQAPLRSSGDRAALSYSDGQRFDSSRRDE